MKSPAASAIARAASQMPMTSLSTPAPASTPPRYRWPLPLYYMCIVALALLAVVPRFSHLGERPLMHDEGQDAYYSYLAWKNHHYTFNPILHGPLIQLSTGQMLRFFGDTAGVARGYIAFCSLIALACMVAFAPRRSRAWFTLLLVLSPELLYYSRFMRAEMLFNAWFMLGMLGVMRGLAARKSGAPFTAGLWSVLAGFTLTGLLAIKINAIFVYATGFTFLALWAAVRILWKGAPISLRHIRSAAPPPSRRGKVPAPPTPILARPAGSSPSPQTSASAPVAALIRSGVLDMIVGWAVGIALGIVLVIYTYGITGSDDKVFTPKKNLIYMWNYWFGQHTVQRIDGPLHFHLPILVTYELPLVVMLLAGITLDMFRTRWRAAIYLVSMATWLLLWQCWHWFPPISPLPIDPHIHVGLVSKISNLLHVKPDYSFLALGSVIVPLLVWAVLQLKEHRTVAAWCAWWGACSLFQYSSAGEKVPWLGVYFVMPFYLTAAWMWAPRLRKATPALRTLFAAGLVVAVLITMRIDRRLLTRGADPSEVLVYNHTTIEYQDLLNGLLADWQKNSQRIPLDQRNVALSGAAEWPSYWYLRHVHTYVSDTPAPDTDLMLGEESMIQHVPGVIPGMEWKTGVLMLRNAWISDWPTQNPWSTWWTYYWTRKTWGVPLGGFNISYAIPSVMRK